ncbi:MAG: DUF1206 domain-containing protein [Pseudomonadota bacterium]
MPSRLSLSTVFKWLGRIGLIARALVYLAISVILFAGLAFLNEPTDGAAPDEAFESVELMPFGPLILIAFSVALLTYTAFRFIQAYTYDEEDGAAGQFARLGMILSGLSYGAVAIAAMLVASGENTGSGPGVTREVVLFLLKQPAGQTLIGVFGLIVLVIAILQLYRPLRGQWKDSLDLKNAPKPLILFSDFAIFGRGILIAIVGLSIGFVAISAQPDDAMGVSQTLSWLSAQPFGRWMYALAGTVFLGYAVYGFLQAATHRFDL